MIVKAVKHGVKSFDPKRITRVATDWSKIGIGFCLLQKVCCAVPATLLQLSQDTAPWRVRAWEWFGPSSKPSTLSLYVKT